MKNFTQTKFDAFKVLMEDFASTSASLMFFDGDVTTLSLNVTNKTKTIKVEVIGYKQAPVKRMSIQYGLENFQKLNFDEFNEVIGQMERSVRP